MPSQVHGNPDHRKLRSPPSVPEFARLFAGGESIRNFSSAMPRHRQQRGRLQGEWRLLEPPKQLYRFAEADDRSGDSPAPTVDRPQPDRSLKAAAYLARNRNFESIPLQRGVVRT